MEKRGKYKQKEETVRKLTMFFNKVKEDEKQFKDINYELGRNIQE